MTHSVTLETDKCKGCAICVRRCPTEAIRVRRGKAAVISERCIDCGRCVFACPNHAWHTACDSLERMKDFIYTVALPSPALYGQFRNLDSIGIVLGGLLEMGFNAVCEPARAAEELSAYAVMKYGKEDLWSPLLISASCPVCVRLICQRYPELIPYLAPEYGPVELAAAAARSEAVRNTGLKPDEIGVFFITPCPAQMTAAHSPPGLREPVLDGAFSMAEVYIKLLPAMKRAQKSRRSFQTAGKAGVSRAFSGGESAPLKNLKTITADGISNVIDILESIDAAGMPEADFAELAACPQGCVGGCLTVENPYIAKMRIQALMRPLPQTGPETAHGGPPPVREVPLEYMPADVLDEDMTKAIEKRRAIAAMLRRLPGRDCAACGAPGCRAFAEDVVLGYSKEEACLFLLEGMTFEEK